MIPSTVAEEDVVMVSALEHYSYCPRQCALIHREQTYDENIFTLRGSAVHERVDEPKAAVADGVRVERGLPIWSAELGLVGKADVVEFHVASDCASRMRIETYPVEYKHGPVRRGRHADIQVCAQAMCLEEMLGVPVPKGAVYHFSSRKRREVVFTPELRQRVRDTAEAVRRILRSDPLPAPVADARCKNCSLLESCLPFAVVNKGRISTLQRRLFNPITFRDNASERS